MNNASNQLKPMSLDPCLFETVWTSDKLSRLQFTLFWKRGQFKGFRDCLVKWLDIEVPKGNKWKPTEEMYNQLEKREKMGIL